MVRWLVPLVLLIPAAWLALLVAAPMLPAPAAALVYAFCSLVCHQISDRSFYLAAAQLPVCARCLGIYAGAALAALGPDPFRALGWAPTPRQVLIAGAVPTVATVALEWADVWRPSNVERAAAGAMLGIAVALVVKAGLATLNYDECLQPPPIAPDRPPSHT